MNTKLNTNKNRRGHNFIGVAMEPEALVAATLAVSQERKSFTTNHTSILKIVRFIAQKRGSVRCLTQPFFRFRWDRQTHTHTHKTTTVTLAAHARRGLIIVHATLKGPLGAMLYTVDKIIRP